MTLKMKTLDHQDLMDLVDGAAIFSAGGGGAPEAGYRIVDKLVSEGFTIKIVDTSETPSNAKIVNFACVGATTSVEYDPDAAVETLRVLEEYADLSAYATVPVELGGFNTLVAVDTAARSNIPVVDADGAGRSVPEVHLKVYTIDNIPLTPFVIADLHAKNVVIVKETLDSNAAERIARVLAGEWNDSVYTARRVLTGIQVRTSPIQLSLSKSMRIGELLRKAVNPVKAVLQETDGFRLFKGIVKCAEKKTEAGFTFTDVEMRGKHEYSGSIFEFKSKNEVLVAYRDKKVSSIAPDIITPVNPETGKCVTAEKIEEGNELTVISLPSPQKWRTRVGLLLWKDVLQRFGIKEEYVPIEKMALV